MNRKLVLLFLFPVLLFAQTKVNDVQSASVIVTRDYELTRADSTVLVYARNNPVKITLPPSTGSGQLYHIKKIEDSDEVVTIATRGTDLIDGAVTVNLMNQWAGALLQDDNPGYWDNIGSVVDGDDL